MKTMKRKGFTLVELLVVIAILAILAGVGVAGYTAFIERAYVSNDNTMAAQLNSMLTYMKADSNGDFYNADIKEENVWAATQTILDEAGFDGLAPQSLEYGYHFYFNLTTQEFVVLNDKDVMNTGMKAFINIFADSTDKPGFFTYGEDRLFLVDTAGSALADAVRGFNTFDIDIPADAEDYAAQYEAAVTEKFNELIESVKKADEENGTNYTEVLANQGVQVDTYILSTGSGELKDPITHSGVTDYTNIKITVDEEGNVTKTNPSTDTPTFNVTENKTLNLSGDSTVVAGSFNVNVAAGATLILNFTVENPEDIANIVDAEFASSNVVIIINGKEYQHAEDDAKLLPNPETNPEGTDISLKYRNPMLTFDIMANGVTNKVTDSIKEGFVAWDVENGKFTLTVVNAQGNPEKPNDPISVKDVIWRVAEESEAYLKVVDEVSGVFQLLNTDKAAPAIDTLSVIATPRIGKDGTESDADGNKVPQTYTVKLVRATGISGLKLDGKDVDFENVVALLNGVKNGEAVSNSTFALEEGNVKIRFNHTAAEGTIVLDDATLSLVANGTFDVSADGKSLTLVNTLSDLLEAKKITLNVGKYFTKEISISMFNQFKLNFIENANNAQIKLVGDENAITLGDLFELQSGMELPKDAQVWFSSAFGGTTTMPGDIDMENYSDSRHGTTVTALNDAWKTTPIQFNDGTNNSKQAPEVNVAIVVPTENGGYRRISAVRTIKVVDGWNIKAGQYSLLKEKSNAGSSVVLLGDVTADVANTYFAIASGATFYGNRFSLDLSTNGYMGGDETIGAMYGIIALSGSIQDTEIIGKVYGTFAGSANDKFGTNLIAAVNGAKITNCYISNTRSPLTIHGGGTVTVEDTVIFGGRYANVDIRDGHLLIKGDVTTVQQIVQGLDKDNKTVDVIGVGISCWFEDYKHSVTVETGANLKQYNFMNSDLSKTLPPLSYEGVELMKLAEPFNQLFTDTYKAYRFGDNLDYVNSGIVSIDKYSLKITVDKSVIKEYTILGTGYGQYKYTVKAKTSVANDEIFKIVYDSSKYNCTSATVNSDTNFVEVTGEQFKAGVVFEMKSGTIIVLGLDTRLYDFYVTSSNYVALSVSNLNNYVQVNYPYEMGGIFTTAGSVVDFHGKGMHYKVMDFDIWTPNKDNSQHQNTFNEYLALGNTYMPKTYQLTSYAE